MKKISISFLFTAAILISMAYLPFATATGLQYGPVIVDPLVAHPSSTALSFQRKSFLDVVYGWPYVFYGSANTPNGRNMAYASTWAVTDYLGSPSWPALAGSFLTQWGFQFSVWYDDIANRVYYVRVEPNYAPGGPIGSRLIYNWGTPWDAGAIVWNPGGEQEIPNAPLPGGPLSKPYYYAPSIAVDGGGQIWVSVRASFSIGSGTPSVPPGVYSYPVLWYQGLEQGGGQGWVAWHGLLGANPPLSSLSSSTWWTTVVTDPTTAGKAYVIGAWAQSAGIRISGTLAAPYPTLPWAFVSDLGTIGFGGFSAVFVNDPQDQFAGSLGSDIVHIAYLAKEPSGSTIRHSTVAFAPAPSPYVDSADAANPIVPAPASGNPAQIYTYPTITAERLVGPDTLYVRWVRTPAQAQSNVMDIARVNNAWTPPQIFFTTTLPIMTYVLTWSLQSLTSYAYSYPVPPGLPYSPFEGTAVTENLATPYLIEFAAS